MTKSLTAQETEVLKMIAGGSPFQPFHPKNITDRLLELKLITQTLSGSFAVTEDGMFAAYPEAVAAAIARRKI